MKNEAKAIFNKAIESVNPEKAVREHLKLHKQKLSIENLRFSLDHFRRIVVVGAGKASAAMGKGLEGVLRKRIERGLVIVKYSHVEPLTRIDVREAGHPVPDENGLQAAKRLLALVQSCDEQSLIIGLISGGGSALLTLPTDRIRLEEKIATTEALLKCGASIDEINTIRKHISRVKGGRLMEYAFPATFLALIISDVVGDQLDVIASGPTVPDPTTYEDCSRIIQKYNLYEELPPNIVSFFEEGKEGKYAETPKPGNPVFNNSYQKIICNNLRALNAARDEAVRLGYNTIILSSLIEGDTSEAARFHTAIIKEILKSANPIGRPACILSGGETTVVVKGSGHGGRNQEFALVSALEIEGLENVCVLSAGTDGTDGPTSAAGAFATGDTVSRARYKGLSAEMFLENNDSFTFFDSLGDLLVTGPTKTNVMDLRICLIK